MPYCQPTGNAQQIVAPPLNQTVPLNSVARFTCRTTSFVVWEINNAQLLLDSERAVDGFKMQGIRVERENESVLLVNATLNNTRTEIRCWTGSNYPELTRMSAVAVLIVFGEW